LSYGFDVCKLVEGWNAKVVFTSGGNARHYVVTHIEEGRKHRREGRRKALLKWLDGRFL
jgi:hypothetical protein